jgi:hypothetical protein
MFEVGIPERLLYTVLLSASTRMGTQLMHICKLIKKSHICWMIKKLKVMYWCTWRCLYLCHSDFKYYGFIIHIYNCIKRTHFN